MLLGGRGVGPGKGGVQRRPLPLQPALDIPLYLLKRLLPQPRLAGGGQWGAKQALLEGGRGGGGGCWT